MADKIEIEECKFELSDYQSPITVAVQRISEGIGEHAKCVEEMILREIERIGVIVDKEELIKALNYDREQYYTGYRVGYNDGIDSATQHAYWYDDCGKLRCSLCEEYQSEYGCDEETEFCPHCGARMDSCKEEEDG